MARHSSARYLELLQTQTFTRIRAQAGTFDAYGKEIPMKNRMMCIHLFWVLAASLLFSASAWAQYQNGVQPGPGWQVMKAEWGAGNRWQDVTNRVRALLSGNGRIVITTANMGGDPAYGVIKTLRIQARNSRGQSQQFNIRENNTLDASQFYNYGGGNGNPRPGNPGYPTNPGYPGGGGGGGGGNGNLQIVRAYYGLNNRTNDVTQLLRGMVRNGTLVVQVTNNNMGGDPARGGDKVLTVIYRSRGREQTSTVKEGNTLRIP
jgi:hypothetical protein